MKSDERTQAIAAHCLRNGRLGRTQELARVKPCPILWIKDGRLNDELPVSVTYFKNGFLRSEAMNPPEEAAMDREEIPALKGARFRISVVVSSPDEYIAPISEK